MSRVCFDPKKCIGPLNNAKQALQWKNVPFDKETLLNNLKACGLPTNNIFWSALRKSNILQEVSKGKYMFTSKEPIFVGALEEVKKSYQGIIKKHNNKQSKKKVEDTLEIPENDPKAMTQFAIDLLKEQGYKILAPVDIVYKEV